MRQFNYQETKQTIVLDIFNTLKDKGYNMNNPIRIPEEMEGYTIDVHAYDKILDLDCFVCLTALEIQSSENTLVIIGKVAESEEECYYDDSELDIDSLNGVFIFVEDMPDAEKATYENDEED